MSDFTSHDWEQIHEKQMEERLTKIKKMLDKAYLDTKAKYGKLQADNAMTNYYLYCDYGFFTGKENRQKLKKFLEHPNEFQQVLLDYAISKYISEETRGIQHKVTLEDVKKYTDTNNKDLNYNPHFVTSAVALGTAWSPFWIVNVISCNPEVKRVLVSDFVKGRYSSMEKREILDNSKKTKIVRQSNGKPLTMSKYKLNHNIEVMNTDDGLDPYDPDKEIVKAEGKSR